MRHCSPHYQITLADALAAHEKALSLGSVEGIEGVINLGSIESAIARPYSGYYCAIHGKAAALTESMVRNHGFADGNKRTTVFLLQLLLEESGYRLTALQEPGEIQVEVEKMILSVARSELSFDDLVRWFENRIVKT